MSLPPPLSKLHFGLDVEERALAWYRAAVPSAKLIARNFRCRVGEIDLVFEETSPSRPGSELVFIEVRARLPSSLESGLESLRHAKRVRLSRAIAYFLARYPGSAQRLRVDLLAWDGRDWLHVPDLRLDV